MRGLQIGNPPRSHRGIYQRRHQQQFADLYPGYGDEEVHHQPIEGLRETMAGVELQPDECDVEETHRRKKKKA